MQSPRRTKTWIGVAAAAVVATLAVGGCSATSPSKDSASGGLPKQIYIAEVADVTGLAAGPTASVEKGAQLALQEISDSKYLGDTELVLEKKDSASTAQNAAALMAGDVADSRYSAVLGPVDSPGAQAMSPIAEKSQIPILYCLAGSAGVVIGAYTFRASPPAATYYKVTIDHLVVEKVKTLSVIYSTGISTTNELATQTIPKLAGDANIMILSSTGVANDVTDFTTVAAKVAQQKPDAVAVLMQTAQVSASVVALRQAGYNGIYTGFSGTNKETLAAAGEDAAGFIYSAAFHPDMPGTSVKKFVAAFQAKHGQAPTYYSAEGYDRIWWLARGIKEAGSTGRTAIQKGLSAVAVKGFAAAEGDLTFDGNDVRTKGVLLEYDGKSGETLVK